MKKLVLFLLVIVMAAVPLLACGAANSRENEDIQETDITDVVPENGDEPVAVPDIDIVTDPEDVIELQEELQTIFHLMVQYVYMDGTTAAETVSEILPAGSSYSIPSPLIDGYIAFLQQVDGVMPSCNLQYTVIYVSPEEAGLYAVASLFDLEIPLGLGFVVDNTGVCSE